MYTEYQTYLSVSEDTNTGKIIETGTLINDLYETDSFSRIALLTKKQGDFDTYLRKSEFLFERIDELKELISDPKQNRQLDSVKSLLEQKSTNIEQLRILKLMSEQDTTLDEILQEFKNFHKEMGGMYLEDLIKKPGRLNRNERRIYQSYLDYYNRQMLDTTKLGGFTIDSLLTVSRYIVLEAKKENSRTRKELLEKENELLQNEFNISLQLRSIITDFDAKMSENNRLENEQRRVSEARTKNILRLAAIAGALIMVLFSYIIVTDFFKAEKYKKRLQREKRYSEDLLKSREQLMATVSHDLKTPLNTIVGYSELFAHTQLTEKQKNYTQQIASSAHFISKMADDLLDFSKLEAGKLLIEKVPFSLENLLHQIAKASKDLHIQKSVDLHLYVDEELCSKLFESDPLRIQQIVNNLVSNAYKFTEKGHIQITANLLKKKGSNHIVEIAVTDSGIGISKEKQQLIFKEFTQAEKDTFQKFGGSGLGLAISRKIAQLMGGTLEVDSVLGEGSTFYFTVPLEASVVVKAIDPPKMTTPQLKSSLRAVIFDDDPAMLALLKELFEQMNIRVHGYVAYEEFKNNGSIDFDFVLTDIEMPTHSGIQILEALKNGEIKGFQNQPIIAMTGTKKFSRNEYLQMGFSDLLQKPFSKNQLIAALSPLFLNKLETNLPTLEVFRNPTNEIFDLFFMNSFLSNEDSLNEVLYIFYQQTEQDLSQMATAIQNFDCDALASTAHRMLTMCRQLGAKRVNPILETMEQYALNSPTQTEMETLFANLKIEIKTLVEALQNRILATA
jgi:signal transduction histidine kinase/HPt (histidine-containing phosphotransfer) domain-containing protein/ActR/RegA family two-component response regulator